ncbi:unnamed protein product [Cuscuta campestris]|uniref:DUF7769 domain-containing protein n=1 Tax=Cuscuta campestris TaxID=132261 RepID=A0A484N731_9ASTE|nr:unnamed protein product [Cuscuta campestris]
MSPHVADSPASLSHHSAFIVSLVPSFNPSCHESLQSEHQEITKRLSNAQRQRIIELILLYSRKNISGQYTAQKGIISKVAADFNVSRRTVGAIWSRARKQPLEGVAIDVKSRLPVNSGRKRVSIDIETIGNTPLAQRTTISSLAASLENGEILWDGKIGIFPFVETVAAKRKSKNREAGVLEVKQLLSVTKEVTKDMLVNQEVMNNDGGNKYKLPHMPKDRLAREGTLPVTLNVPHTLLEKTLENFRAYKKQMEESIGMVDTKILVNDAFFLVSTAGTNDFALNYDGNIVPFRNNTYTLQGYADYVRHSVQQFLQPCGYPSSFVRITYAQMLDQRQPPTLVPLRGIFDPSFLPQLVKSTICDLSVSNTPTFTAAAAAQP